MRSWELYKLSPTTSHDSRWNRITFFIVCAFGVKYIFVTSSWSEGLCDLFFFLLKAATQKALLAQLNLLPRNSRHFPWKSCLLSKMFALLLILTASECKVNCCTSSSLCCPLVTKTNEYRIYWWFFFFLNFAQLFSSFAFRLLKSKMSGCRSYIRWVGFQTPSAALFWCLALPTPVSSGHAITIFHVSCHASPNVSLNPSAVSDIDAPGRVCSEDKHRPSAPFTNEAHLSLQLSVDPLHSSVA